MNILKNKKGFTLIELIIVIVILGILSRLAVPNVQEAVKMSRIKVALQNVKTVQDTIDKFYIENGRFPQLTDYTDQENWWCWTGYSDELDNKLGGNLAVSKMGIGYEVYSDWAYDPVKGWYETGNQYYYLYFNNLNKIGLKHEDVYLIQNFVPDNWGYDGYTDSSYPDNGYSYFYFIGRYASDI